MSVKRNYVASKGSNRLLRLLNAIRDRSFCDIPVYSWVIEHPEGNIIIDVGETTHFNDPDFFPAIERSYWHSQYRFKMRPEDEIGAQLRQLGIPPEEVRLVILTHGHFDHTGGLGAFPNAKFLISAREWSDVIHYRSAHFALPSRFPSWFRPTPIEYDPVPIGSFSESYSVTHAGDICVVPTPGHTMGHQSVILRDGDDTIFFAGDASFDQASLLNGTLDAPAFNANVVQKTRYRIRAYARETQLVYLTTHDSQTAVRLEQRLALNT